MVLLRGMHSYPPQRVSMYRMEEDLRHEDIEWVVELKISNTGGKPQPPHLDIQTILDRYPTMVGDIPPRRPPDREFEHTIELELGV